MSFAQLCEDFQRLIERDFIPGAILWVDRGGKPLVREALGRLDPASAAPMTLDAIFRIYSMTKPVTSVAVLMLVEEGLLALDDPVKAFLPEFADPRVGVVEEGPNGAFLSERRATRDASVRDLLRHTAGLTYGSFDRSLVKDLYLKSGVESRRLNNQEFVRRLATLPLAFEPGTTWEYSRATDVLGALIERLSGLSLGRFLGERIFAPLAMSDTGFWVPPTRHSRIAMPFPVDPENGTPVRVINVHEPPVFESGGGGLVSTAADYARFQSMLRGLGALGSTRLLQPDSVRLMTCDHLGSLDRGPNYLPGPDYGFGLGVAVRQRVAGTGSIGDYYWGGLAGTFQWIDPEEDLSAILMLQAPNQRESLRSLFYQDVYRALRSRA